jgi:hypothetical protein
MNKRTTDGLAPTSAPLSIWGETMASDETVQMASAIKDRRAALIGYGIVEVLAGIFVLMPSFVDAHTPPDARMAILIPLVSGAAGIPFICAGIGSILCRRWGRALSLVLSWIWLIVGTHQALFTCRLALRLSMREYPHSEMDTAFAFFTIFWGLICFVLMPGVLILFYNNKHVKATVERRDPHIRWTDSCPAPVLLISAICEFVACYSVLFLMSVLAESVLLAKPLSEITQTHILGDFEFLALTLFVCYVAWGAYRLEIRAWWCAVIVVVAWGFSSEAVRLLAPTQGTWQLPPVALYAIAILGYLLYVRKFFKQAGRPPHNEPN